MIANPHQTVQNTPLFACAIGSGAPSLPVFNNNNSTASLPLPSAYTTGNGPSPDSWARLDAIMKVASRTGHSSFYVEKGRQVLGKSANELGKCKQRLPSLYIVISFCAIFPSILSSESLSPHPVVSPSMVARHRSYFDFRHV